MLDQTCDEVYFKTIVDVVEAYSREGSVEAARRKLAVLMAWVIAGRASESAWLTFDAMHFDQFFSKVFQEVPQVKISKPKFIAFSPGTCEFSDIYLAFADFMSMIGVCSPACCVHVYVFGRSEIWCRHVLKR